MITYEYNFSLVYPEFTQNSTLLLDMGYHELKVLPNGRGKNNIGFAYNIRADYDETWLPLTRNREFIVAEMESYDVKC